MNWSRQAREEKATRGHSRAENRTWESSRDSNDVPIMSQPTPTEEEMRPSSPTLIPLHQLFPAQVLPKLDVMSPWTPPGGAFHGLLLPEPTASSGEVSELCGGPAPHGALRYPAPSISP